MPDTLRRIARYIEESGWSFQEILSVDDGSTDGTAAAADTAWVIASPDTHDLLVRRAAYSYDQLEDWVRTTLTAALLADS